MSWIPCRAGMIALAAIGLASCDRLALGPPAAEPAPAVQTPVTPAAEVDPALRSHAGETYAAFVSAAGARYAPEGLGLAGADSDRFGRAMQRPAASAVLSGGGADALVFRGCSETGCEDALAIVAIDVATGTAFVGVKDAEGAEILAPNDRVEALLRLNSPTRNWHNPEASPEAAAP